MDNLRKLCCRCRGHKSHLAKLLSNTDKILSKLPAEALTVSEVTSLKDYLKQLKQKSTVFANIDKESLDNLEDEGEFETMVYKSEDLQTTLSKKISLLTCQLTLHVRISPQITAATSEDTNTHPPLLLPNNEPLTQDANTDTMSQNTTASDNQVPLTANLQTEQTTNPIEIDGEPAEGKIGYQFTARLPKLDVPSFAGDPLGGSHFGTVLKLLSTSTPA